MILLSEIEIKNYNDSLHQKHPSHQQITLFWTVLDNATQSHRVPSLVHTEQLCPDRHRLWTSVEVCTALPSSPQMYRIISNTSTHLPLVLLATPILGFVQKPIQSSHSSLYSTKYIINY